MRIAFDLDNTLIRSGYDFPLEPLGALPRLLGSERLRKGTRKLIRQLQADGHDVWIYTSSFRSILQIRLMFAAHGLWLQGIVNQARHDYVIQRYSFVGSRPSKYPPAFQIDWLIDDSEGHRLEGEQFNFRVLRLLPDDLDWAATLLNQINR